MHFNKNQTNDLAENEINNQSFFRNKTLTKTQNKIETKANRLPTPCLETKKKRGRPAVRGQNEASAAGKAARLTATTNSTDSTDSGVNLSDNDDAPLNSPHLHSFETNCTASHCHKELLKHNNNKNTSSDNNANNAEGNKCKNVINNNKNNIVNYNNDVDYDDENENINSQNFDNKFRVADSSREGNSTRYQEETQNFIDSKCAVNICQQTNLETLTPITTTSKRIATTSEEYDDKSSFAYNEFIHLQERSCSTTSSLSMSSLTNSYDDNLPPSMHHCKASPVVSIRSINSTIISSDTDSDSELNSDAENYVIKKLGTQVTYSPNDATIPNISSGHTVLNQKVIPNSNQAPLPPIEALAVIGDRIGAAQALGPVPLISGVAQRPQIGSVALSNSSDVTFGDKHFYEGPVTIQQFLIDNREKWKETNGKDNPNFSDENFASSTNNAKDTNPEAEKSSSLYQNILKRKRTIIPGVLAFTTLLIVATIWGSKMLNESKNTNGSSDNSEGCTGNGTICLIDREGWQALPQTGILDKQKLPLQRVVISHTASEPCESLQVCAYRVRVIQEFHMNSLKWDDIGYNFLIGSEGRVYMGRGWDYVGAHTKGYNTGSVGISFIGTFIAVEPTEAQVNACLSLLEEGIRLKKLAPDYRLYGARQMGSTESPGEMLFKRIKKWKHWSPKVELP